MQLECGVKKDKKGDKNKEKVMIKTQINSFIKKKNVIEKNQRKDKER